MNLKFYKPEVLMKGISAIAGEQAEFVPLHYRRLPKTPLVKAFLDDDDIQEITFCSANLGFVRTLQKQYQVPK